MSALVLVIDDETDLLATLEYNLQNDGYRTRVARTAGEGLALANREPTPDLVLLDVMLPDRSGVEVCRELKGGARTREIPVVMLTARGEEIDRVVGFEMGADDYVTKPFSVRELLLRIRAVLRRTQSDRPERLTIEFGQLRIDGAAHRCFVDGVEAKLTALEFRLLTTLVERKGRVQSRDVLLNDVWGLSSELTTRTVDTHMKRLRQKLGNAGRYIETIRGVGYRFREAASEVEG